jgi:hypothetical protein
MPLGLTCPLDALQGPLLEVLDALGIEVSTDFDASAIDQPADGRVTQAVTIQAGNATETVQAQAGTG